MNHPAAPSFRMAGLAFDPPPNVDPSPVWERLGKTEAAEWVHTPLTEQELAKVRRAVATGRPFG